MKHDEGVKMTLDSCLDMAIDMVEPGGRVVVRPVGLDDSFRWLAVWMDVDTWDYEVLDSFGYPVFRDSWINEYDEWEVWNG